MSSILEIYPIIENIIKYLDLKDIQNLLILNDIIRKNILLIRNKKYSIDIHTYILYKNNSGINNYNNVIVNSCRFLHWNYNVSKSYDESKYIYKKCYIDLDKKHIIIKCSYETLSLYIIFIETKIIKYSDIFNYNLYSYKIYLIDKNTNANVKISHKKIHTLIFTDFVNCDTLLLPDSLKILKFHVFFRGIIQVIPNSIKKISFAGNSQKNYNLPITLKYLNFTCYNLNNLFNNNIYNNLTYLGIIIVECFEDISFNNFKNLKYLHIQGTVGKFYVDKLKNLEELSIKNVGKTCIYNVNKLPINLKKLSIDGYFNKPINILPKNLKILIINSDFNQNIDNLPENLQELYLLGDEFNKPIDKLPTELKILELGKYFNQNIDNLPDSLILLKLKYKFDQLINKLPDNLDSLYFLTEQYNHKLFNTMPKQLKKIYFGGKYYPDLILNLPTTLQLIKIETLSDFPMYLDINSNINIEFKNNPWKDFTYFYINNKKKYKVNINSEYPNIIRYL